MRASTLSLLAILATSANLQQLQIKGCLAWNKANNACGACYRRQVTTYGCGPLLPASDNCLIHREQPGQQTRCILCRAGYATNNEFDCVPTDIFNCPYASIAEDGLSQCDGCGNGQYPHTEGKSCTPITGGAIANCQWGRTLATSGLRGCVRCLPGFAVTYFDRKCVASAANTTGCWVLSEDQSSCFTCDVVAGYSMQKNGQCKFIAKE